MGYIKSVQILNSIQDLIEYSSSCSFFQPYLCCHDFEKFPLLCKLSHNIDMLSGLYDLIEVYDVGVSYFFHDLDLSLNSKFVVFIFN